MAAQTASTASSATTLPKQRRSLSTSVSAAAAGSSGKAKRPRTKHACDECRRSQKKVRAHRSASRVFFALFANPSSNGQCDGEKPLCRRCYINGTQCTYTPHKNRSSCVCTGPDDVRADGPIPDVFIFPSGMYQSCLKCLYKRRCLKFDTASPTSFYTWSSSNSPNQSPSTSGSEIPSPTYLTMDDKVKAESLAAGHGDQQTSQPHLHLGDQAQTQILSTGFSPRSIYTHSRRSCSAPNVSTGATLSSSPCPIFIATPAHSSDLPHYQLDSAPSTPYGSVSSSNSGFSDSSPSSTYSDLLTPHGFHIHDGASTTSLDFASHGSELHFDTGFDSFYDGSMMFNMNGLHQSTAEQKAQDPNSGVTASYQLDSGAFHSNMLDLSSVSQLQPALFGSPHTSNQNNNSSQTDSLQFQLGPAFTQAYPQSQQQQQDTSNGSLEGLSLEDLSGARAHRATPDMHARGVEQQQQQLFSPFASPSSQGTSGWSSSELNGFQNASPHPQTHSAPASGLPSPTSFQSFDVYAWAQ